LGIRERIIQGAANLLKIYGIRTLAIDAIIEDIAKITSWKANFKHKYQL
jgi:hypothetical protein